MTKTVTKKRQPSAANDTDWKGKTPNRWKSSPSKSGGSAIGFKMVSVKMRPAEAEEFALRCKEIGVSKNHALRVMARKVCGFLEIDQEAVAEIKDISRQLRGIATNINQIAKAANRTHDPDYRAFMQDRSELAPEIIRLQKYLQQVLDEGVRREDGLARLKEAVTAP